MMTKKQFWNQHSEYCYCGFKCEICEEIIRNNYLLIFNKDNEPMYICKDCFLKGE